MPRISFPSKGLSGRTEPGRTLHEAVHRLGHIMDYACGGNSLCGTCCVLVVEGEGLLTPVSREEAERLRELDLGPPYRLSCQARVVEEHGGHQEDGEITIVAG